MSKFTDAARALTIHQAWAWAVVEGLKPVENRSWESTFVGPMLIHAGDADDSLPASLKRCAENGVRVPMLLDYSAILGVAIVWRSKPSDHPSLTPEELRWTDPGGYVIQIPKSVLKFPKPIGCGGAQKWWKPEADVLKRVEMQLKQMAFDNPVAEAIVAGQYPTVF